VSVIHPDEAATDLRALRVDHDLYVLKAGTETALSLAGALHARGAAILNPYPVSAMCRDKIVASAVLHEAGVPIPPSYVASREDELEPLLDQGPLVVKPYRGSQGIGVRVVRRRADLRRIHRGTGPVFAQRYFEPDGPDRKIYCIGDAVFGVERVWPARTYHQKLGKPFTVGSDLSALAIRCGAAFGMSLFGFDVVLSGGRPYVVDISSFPGFKGVPDAAALLARHILAAADDASHGVQVPAGLTAPGW
jgi:ribosomal protein S6--L-glutamate ligase